MGILTAHEIYKFMSYSRCLEHGITFLYICGLHQYTVRAINRLWTLIHEDCRIVMTATATSVLYTNPVLLNYQQTMSTHHFHVVIHVIGTKSVSLINNLFDGTEPRVAQTVKIFSIFYRLKKKKKVHYRTSNHKSVTVILPELTSIHPFLQDPY